MSHPGSRSRARAALVIALVGSVAFAARGEAQSAGGPIRTSAHAPTPLTLAEVLMRVSAGHPVLAGARARIGSARGARRAAAGLPNPMLWSQVENVRLPGGAPASMDREVMATATLPLEFLYQRGARVGQAEATMLAAESDAMSVRQRLALDAAHTYYLVALSQIEVATARDLAAWLDSLVAYNQARTREGAAAEVDLLRSQLERDRAWADVTLRQVELVRARADLAALLGDSTTILAPLDAPTSVPAVVAPDLPLLIPTDDRATQLGRGPTSDGRPEIRAARARLMAASAGVGAARSRLVRDLGVTAGLKWTGGTTSMVAGLSLPLPLLNQNGGEVAQARAERDMATAELAAAERAARADIVAAAEGVRLLTERTEHLARGGEGPPGTGIAYLARADEARRITFGAYQEGAVPLLQVLDAARIRGDARVVYYRALYTQHESVLALLAAEGRDLFSAAPSLTTSTTNGGDTSPGARR